MQNETQQNNMSFERKEELINELLLYMKNAMESKGETIKGYMFDFSLIYENNDRQMFRKIINFSDEEFEKIFNSCKSHEYIRKRCSGNNDYNWMLLTEKGLTRANSFEKAKYYKPQEQKAAIDLSGATIKALQIGNHNTQNIQTIINDLIDEVKKSDATPEDKNKAIELINYFFANPIISSVISGATGAGVTSLLGGM